ncbi:hypothetical protein D477_014286 [Arthrobacter crystallopoietes BAB-32]|uniref:DUF2188 domain-containing protein n=1 Tax=Arthrobacter crystallopoietes BAB-32 TaxID=1246476 RepID=N1V0G5_9MICC|nr:DUF2188 domain-containing protein [Arthrobacter crystallopoietes]EMY33577.1 hypothetical protein D477_014286 [Arthrobacter crystallopoietes BAB-32]
MSTKTAVETYWEDGTWKSRHRGADWHFAVGGTRDQAILVGRAAARNRETEHVVIEPDGHIVERHDDGCRRVE